MLPPESIAATLLAERLPFTACFAGVTRDCHLSEDVFQEVSVKAVDRVAEFESPAHLIHWARVAGRNRSIDLLRARDGRYIGLSEAILPTIASGAAFPRGYQAHQRRPRCVETRERPEGPRPRSEDRFHQGRRHLQEGPFHP